MPEQVKVRVQPDPFDAGAELNAFISGRPDVGAVVSFTGIVRDRDGGLTASPTIPLIARSVMPG